MLCLRSSMVMLAITKPTGQCPLSTQSYLRISKGLENQDGGVDRHTAPPCTTRTDRKSNGKEVHTKEIKNKHSSRPVGGAETGTGVERTHVAVADRDWRSVGRTGQAV